MYRFFGQMYTMLLVIYLGTNIFFVEIENQVTDYRKILCVVSQGSILGPLMFLVYVNDISQTVKLNLFLHTDDSYLMQQHRDVKKTEK